MMFFKKEIYDPKIPQGWFVFEMGQSLVHMLWFCQMLESFPKGERKRVYVEEYDTPQEAIEAAAKAVKNKQYFTGPGIGEETQ